MQCAYSVLSYADLFVGHDYGAACSESFDSLIDYDKLLEFNSLLAP